MIPRGSGCPCAYLMRFGYTVQELGQHSCSPDHDGTAWGRILWTDLDSIPQCGTVIGTKLSPEPCPPLARDGASERIILCGITTPVQRTDNQNATDQRAAGAILRVRKAPVKGGTHTQEPVAQVRVAQRIRAHGAQHGL